jgi:drug/metabolite transporter (DMT)-like permease
VAGVLSLAGRPGLAVRAGVGYALLTGALIASYTVWDAHAVSSLDLSVLTYFWAWSFLVRCCFHLSRCGDATKCERRGTSFRAPVLGVGLLSPFAYMLVLGALQLAPVSVVAPAREVSIVLGAALGARLLGEPAGARRVTAATIVVVGIVLLALSR